MGQLASFTNHGCNQDIPGHESKLHTVALVLKKRFVVDGREVIIEETFALGDDGRLTVEMACYNFAISGSSSNNPLHGKMYFRRVGPAPAGMSQLRPVHAKSAPKTSSVLLSESIPQ